MSVTSRGLHRRWSVVAGYYSHDEGPRLVDPFVTGTRFPDLVEMHESQHYYLALANGTDAYGRVLTPALNQDELSAQHREQIVDVMRAIDETTSYCHELLATYSSFQLMFDDRGARLSAARAELPQDYAALLHAGERTFGAVGEGDADTQSSAVLAVLGCTIAALNLPFPNGLGRFGALPRFAEFLRANAPDVRYRAILKQVKPLVNQKSLLHGILALSDADEIQAFVFARLRAAMPRLEFFSHGQRPGIVREWVAEFAEDCERHGYGFMREAVVSPHPEESVVERLGAQITLPGLEDHMPIDLALTRGYATTDLDALPTAAAALAAAGERLFVHFLVYPSDGSDTSLLACHRPERGFPPFGIANVALPEALATLSALPRPSIVIKLDERLGFDRARQLLATGHPVFVLVHDTRPKHLCETIADLAKDQVVEVRVAHLTPDGSYSALLVHPRLDGFIVLSPITALGLRLVARTFQNHERVELWGDEARLPVFASGAMTKRHLTELLAATYVVGR